MQAAFPSLTPDPGASDAMAELQAAAAEWTAGQPQAAMARVSRVAAQVPDDADSLATLGRVAIFLDQPAMALAALERAVALNPRSDARIWLSICLDQLGRRDEALQEIRQAVTYTPQSPKVLFALGMVFERLGHPDEAAQFYAACVALDPDHADAHHRYGRVMHEAGRFDLAVPAYGQALRRCATKGGYYTDLSSAFSNIGNFEQACRAAEVAVALTPDSADAYNNLGHALLNLNRSNEAVSAYDRALALRDPYPRASFGRALALLKSGDFERGWRDYEWRWRDCQTPRADLAVPAWQGEDIAGQTILLHAEQGFGDTLQFIRFAPAVAARGGRVILEVPRPLVRLLRHVDGVSEVVTREEARPAIDRHCPIASLPFACKLRLDGVPATPYLHVPAEQTLRYRSERSPGLVVGLVWAGDPRVFEQRSNQIDQRRSTSLATLSPLFDVEGVQFVSFQLGEARGQLAAFGRVADGMDGVGDFADTAARLGGIDLLISVDTSMVHLAGGLGIPVWMLSRFDGCWRWLEEREDTPWYPTMRIFRQPAPGDWRATVANAAAALRAMAGQRSRAA